MSSKTTLSAIALTLLGNLATGSVGFAEDAPVAHPPNQNHDMISGTNPSQGPGMMGDGSTADMMNMRQMTRMMENCNRMMESADHKPPAPENPPEAKTPPG